MSVRRDPETGAWFFRTTVIKPDGTRKRISGTAGHGVYADLAPTQLGARAAEQRAIRAILNPAPSTKKEAPTFHDWFRGRFWREWVVGRKNKPTEVRSKNIIYGNHLEERIGPLRLDEIDVGVIARLRADLLDEGLSEKRVNNVLAVVSKPLRYAVDCGELARVPRIGMFKCERPEILAWDFGQYARLLAAAKSDDEVWYAAVCLAGEAGLRCGEIKALRWREDVDMIARTITVNQQTCVGNTSDGDDDAAFTTTPKGRTRRTLPMTGRLYDALRRMSTIREGFVVRNLDGSQKTQGQTSPAIERVCRRAGLPVRYWHTLRHTFGTHAALFGVNPWRLQTWMGHKRIDETMIYVHVAEAHARELPAAVREASIGEPDPDRRIVAMLGARGSHVAEVAAGSLEGGTVSVS